MKEPVKQNDMWKVLESSCDKLWETVATQDLISRFANLLAETFSVEEFSHDFIRDPSLVSAPSLTTGVSDTQGHPLEVEEFPSTTPLDQPRALAPKTVIYNLRPVPTTVLLKIQKLILNPQTQSQSDEQKNDVDFAEGLSHYTADVQGTSMTYAFCVLKSQSEGAWLLVWARPQRIPTDHDVLGTAVATDQYYESLLQFLVRHIQQQNRWMGQLDHARSMLYQDDLTGLFNHRYLDIALEAELRRATRFMTPFSIVFLDVDHFKSINDRYGHLVGSDILKQVAQILKDTLREVDVVIRYGGDEFVILLLGTSPGTSVMVADRMRRKIERTTFGVKQELLAASLHMGGQTGDRGESPGRRATDRSESDHHRGQASITLTVSMGLSSFPDHGHSKEDLIAQADAGLYRAKGSGRNRVCLPEKGAQSGKAQTIIAGSMADPNRSQANVRK